MREALHEQLRHVAVVVSDPDGTRAERGRERSIDATISGTDRPDR
jgi:hypothetical protein